MSCWYFSHCVVVLVMRQLGSIWDLTKGFGKLVEIAKNQFWL